MLLDYNQIPDLSLDQELFFSEMLSMFSSKFFKVPNVLICSDFYSNCKYLRVRIFCHLLWHQLLKFDRFHQIFCQLYVKILIYM